MLHGKGLEHGGCPQVHSQRGAVLLMVLVSVTLLGLMAGIAGSSWRTIVQRSKEADLLWKGNQIRQAIGRYYEFSGSGTDTKAKSTGKAMNKFPATLEDLLEDPRALEVTRYLRRLYPDPMTGEDWELIASPESDGIMGVISSSDKEPFKQSDFAEENKGFAGQKSYRGWQFVYQPVKKSSTQKSSTPAASAAD